MTRHELSEQARRQYRQRNPRKAFRFGVGDLASLALAGALIAFIGWYALTVSGPQEMEMARHAEAHGPSMAHEVPVVPKVSYEEAVREMIRWKANAVSIASQCEQMREAR